MNMLAVGRFVGSDARHDSTRRMRASFWGTSFLSLHRRCQLSHMSYWPYQGAQTMLGRVGSGHANGHCTTCVADLPLNANGRAAEELVCQSPSHVNVRSTLDACQCGAMSAPRRLLLPGRLSSPLLKGTSFGGIPVNSNSCDGLACTE